MGQLYDFRCTACGFRREVSGGPDVGMVSGTRTVSCPSCLDLFDVVVSDEPWKDEPGTPLSSIACSQCGNHNLKRWTHPGACPKCGKRPLKRGGPTICWD